MHSALNTAYNDFANTDEELRRKHPPKTLLLFAQSGWGRIGKLFRLSRNSYSVHVNTTYCSLQKLENSVSLLGSYNTQVIVARVTHFTFTNQPQVLVVVFGKERNDSNIVFETVASVRLLT